MDLEGGRSAHVGGGAWTRPAGLSTRLPHCTKTFRSRSQPDGLLVNHMESLEDRPSGAVRLTPGAGG
jgi:hypothetical protein